MAKEIEDPSWRFWHRELPGAVSLLVVLFLLAALTLLVPQRGAVDEVTGMVVEKSPLSSELFVVLDISGETENFKNGKVIWWCKFWPAEFHNSLVVGETYKFKVCGWRIPVISPYRAIISAESIPPQ